MSPRRRAPLFAGALLAVGAALTFGVTMPFVELAGHDVGPLTTAALLYAGACLSALLFARLGRPSGAPRLVAVAVVGAAIAPGLHSHAHPREHCVAMAVEEPCSRSPKTASTHTLTPA